ncbi:TPA: TcfC E-set like domain-containing protein [Photobacterium damselae]
MNKIFKNCTVIIITTLSIINVALAKNINTSNLSNVNIPSVFRDLLLGGMPVVANIKYIGNKNKKAKLTSVIEGNIYLKDNTLMLSYIDIKDKSVLSDNFINKLKAISNMAFDKNGIINIDNKSYIKIDIAKMNLFLFVDKDAFRKKATKREFKIGRSSVDNISSLMSYDFGLSNSWDENSSYTNNYLNLNTITGIRENHIVLDVSLFGIGSTNQITDLRRILYEKDQNGNRFAFGILSGWDLQSLGQVSALQAKRIWGFSYGNKSNSTQIDNSKSYSPIFVFLPSHGEVRIYKNKRLISIQNFEMGSHEIDTTSFPYGNYNITADIVINGKVESSNKYKVNKSSYSNGFSKKVLWQIWGGFMEPFDGYVEGKDKVSDPTYLLGISNSLSFENNHITSSLYSFDNNFLSEFQLKSEITDWLDLTNQLMLASDGSWQVLNAVTINIFEYGSIWGSLEQAQYGKKINEDDEDSYGYGGNINLNVINDHLGNISLSRQVDKKIKSDYKTISYYQHLYNGRYGSLSLKMDYFLNKFEFYDDKEKSISLEYNIPLGSRLKAGISNDASGNISADLSYDDVDINEYISAFGFSLSSQLEGQHDIYATSYINYETDYLDGNVNLSSSGNDSYAMNLSGRGSIGVTDKGIFASNDNSGDSGVIIKSNLGNNESIQAVIDGQRYKVQGEKTLITLNGYKEYKIQLDNDIKVKNSYEIKDKEKTITLYPGNLYTYDISESVVEMITVFGVLKDNQGNILKNTKAHNHIGTTVTDSDGTFVIDVNKNFPIVTAKDHDGTECEADLNIQDGVGAIWIGDTICKGKESYAKN